MGDPYLQIKNEQNILESCPNAPSVSPSLSCRQRTSTTMKILKEAWIQKVKDPRWQLLSLFIFLLLFPLSPDLTLVLRHTGRLCVQPSSSRSHRKLFHPHTENPAPKKTKGLSPLSHRLSRIPAAASCCLFFTAFITQQAWD